MAARHQESRLLDMDAKWSDFVKTAQTFVDGDCKFILGSGKGLLHVVKAWNKAHPDRKVSVPKLMAANGGLKAERFQAGRKYKMPLSAIENNNPGNVRKYGVRWKGELDVGLERGDFSVFDNQDNGLRAAIRTVMNIAKRIPGATISDISKIYEPANSEVHASNISSISKIPKDRPLKTYDDGEMVDYARGLYRSETGNRYYFDPGTLTNIVRSARISQ